MKLTPWYPGTVKPVRDGVYQRKLPKPHGIGFTKFCNGQWLLSYGTAGLAENPTYEPGIWQKSPWRGVAK